MPAQLRVVRRRIRSVQSTMKITRAQELIAASRLLRAQQRVAQSRPYTRQLTTALSEIATTEGRLDHALLREESTEPRLYVVGRKGVAFYRFRQRPVTQSWTGFSDLPRYDDAKEVADTMLGAFLEGEVDEIHTIFIDFVSAAVQRPVARRFIPLVVEE